MAVSCGVLFGSVLSLLAQVGGAADCFPSAFTSGESLAARRSILPSPSQIIIAQTEEWVGVKAFTSASRDLGTVVSGGWGGWGQVSESCDICGLGSDGGNFGNAVVFSVV